jgi:hypothetical protein
MRDEYLPICMAVPVTVNWNDVPAYIETFFPLVDGVSVASSK